MFISVFCLFIFFIKTINKIKNQYFPGFPQNPRVHPHLSLSVCIYIIFQRDNSHRFRGLPRFDALVLIGSAVSSLLSFKGNRLSPLSLLSLSVFQLRFLCFHCLLPDNPFLGAIWVLYCFHFVTLIIYTCVALFPFLPQLYDQIRTPFLLFLAFYSRVFRFVVILLFGFIKPHFYLWL